MKEQFEMEEKLWSYIDGSSTNEERSFIDELLKTNAEWRAKYDELLTVHHMLNENLDLEEPSIRFSKNVMEEIARYQIAPAAKTYINKKIVWGIFAFFIVTILGSIVYALAQAQIDWSSVNSSNLPVDINKIDTEKLNVTSTFNRTYLTIFMMINIVLGLVLLDTYLGKKRRQQNIQ